MNEVRIVAKRFIEAVEQDRLVKNPEKLSEATYQTASIEKIARGCLVLPDHEQFLEMQTQYPHGNYEYDRELWHTIRDHIGTEVESISTCDSNLSCLDALTADFFIYTARQNKIIVSLVRAWMEDPMTIGPPIFDLDPRVEELNIDVE